MAPDRLLDRKTKSAVVRLDLFQKISVIQGLDQLQSVLLLLDRR
jgi:hypothetical protein